MTIVMRQEPVIQYEDVNARKQDYHNRLLYNQLLVTSIFPTIQGEGPLTGRFAIFVRLAGCNLGSKIACPFCDTNFMLAGGKAMSFLDIEVEADRLCNLRPKQIVLTGGEPLMQPYVANFIKHMLDRGWSIQIETNGYFWSADFTTIAAISPARNGHDRLMIIVSPKVNMSMHYPEPSEALLSAASALKILVDADPLSPYYNIPAYVHHWNADKGLPIWISPINKYKRVPGPDDNFWTNSPLDAEACKRNHMWAKTLALAYGYNLSLQTHLISGAE